MVGMQPTDVVACSSEGRYSMTQAVPSARGMPLTPMHLTPTHLEGPRSSLASYQWSRWLPSRGSRHTLLE